MCEILGCRRDASSRHVPGPNMLNLEPSTISWERNIDTVFIRSWGYLWLSQFHVSAELALLRGIKKMGSG